MASKIYKSLVGIAKLRSIHRATLPKSVTVLFQRSPPAQDAIWLAGWICSRSVAIIVHCCTQYLSDHMHQVVAGSGGNTIDLALLSTGTNEEYIKVSVPLKHSTQALNTTPPTHRKSTTYATHTEVVAANQLVIVQHPRATDIGWSTLSITTKCKHM